MITEKELKCIEQTISSYRLQNMFLEEDGYCVRCGENHFKKADQAIRDRNLKVERETSSTEKAIRIKTRIEATPEYREAKEMVKLLSEIYEIPVRVVFTNRNGCFHRKQGDTHTIVFGYQYLDQVVEKGFYEYKTLRWICPQGITGTAASKQVAMHEFAHVLQTRIPGGRTHGSVHNSTFIRTYKEIMELAN